MSTSIKLLAVDGILRLTIKSPKNGYILLNEHLIAWVSKLFAIEVSEPLRSCTLMRGTRGECFPVQRTCLISVNGIPTPHESAWLPVGNDGPEMVLQVLVVAGPKGDSARKFHRSRKKTPWLGRIELLMKNSSLQGKRTIAPNEIRLVVRSQICDQASDFVSGDSEEVTTGRSTTDLPNLC